jgi:hypothetical protein
MRDLGSQQIQKNQAATESSDFLRAIELSMQDSGRRSPSRYRHESRFDKAKVCLPLLATLPRILREATTFFSLSQSLRKTEKK